MSFRRDFSATLKEIGSLPFGSLQEYKMFGEIRKENERLAQEKEQAQLPKLVKELQQMVVA